MDDLEVDITITFEPTNLGQLIFDELDFDPVVGPETSSLFNLLDMLMGGGSPDNGNGGEPQVASPNLFTAQENNGGEPEMPAIVVGVMEALNELFTGVADLAEDPVFLMKLNDTEVQESYGITQEELDAIEQGEVDGATLIEALQIDLVIPLVISNPSVMDLEPGNVSIAFIGENPEDRTQLISIEFPKLERGANQTILIPIGITVPGVVFDDSAEDLDPIAAVFGDATDLSIELTSSIMKLYTLNFAATINFAEMMSSPENGNGPEAPNGGA